MKYKHLFLAYVVLMTMEDFVLKWLPLSQSLYSWSRSFSELLLFFIMAYVMVTKFFTGNLKRTPIDLLLIIFVGLGIFSSFYNHAPMVASLINMKAFLRYFAIYYIVVNVSLSNNTHESIFRYMIILAVVQSLLGVLQHYIGVSDFWMPRATDLEIDGVSKGFKVLDKSGVEEGASIGLFGHTVAMSLYLFIVVALITSSLYIKNHLFSRKFLFAAFVAVFVGIVVTYSRGSLLAAIGLVPFIMLLSKKYKSLMQVSIFGILGIMGYLLISHSAVSDVKNAKKEEVDPMDNFTMIFSTAYVDKAQNSRLWMISQVATGIFAQWNIIGYGADEATSREKIASNSNGVLDRIIYYKGFEDVYWVALFSYYGFVGVFFIILIGKRLYKMASYVYAHTQSTMLRLYALSFQSILVFNILLTFLVRTFEFRSFSFYFFMMAGFVVREYLQLKQNETDYIAQDNKDVEIDAGSEAEDKETIAELPGHPA